MYIQTKTNLSFITLIGVEWYWTTHIQISLQLAVTEHHPQEQASISGPTPQKTTGSVLDQLLHVSFMETTGSI